MSLVELTQKWLYPLPSEPAPSNLNSVYIVACRVFRASAMVVQYAEGIASAIFRPWRWFSSAIPTKYLVVSCRNIANFKVFLKSLKTAWYPISKIMYRRIGRTEGLRMTHDIIHHPASGLCMGISLSFLSRCALQAGSFLEAAKVIKGWGGDETSVKVQAIYDALIGLRGRVNAKEKDFYYRLLQGESVEPQSHQNLSVLASVKAFIDIKDCSKTLRQFVFDDLESKEVEITPHLYALILKLDAMWHFKRHPGTRQCDALEDSIIQAVAHELQLELKETMHVEKEILLASEQLKSLASGSYLILFHDHTIALVKKQDQIALLDSSEGLAVFPQDQQEEVFSHFLKYYSNLHSVAFKLISIEPR